MDSTRVVNISNEEYHTLGSTYEAGQGLTTRQLERAEGPARRAGLLRKAVWETKAGPFTGLPRDAGATGEDGTKVTWFQISKSPPTSPIC